MSVWLTIPKRTPRPVSVAVNCSSSVVGVPAESVARASRLTSPSRLTPRPSPTRNRPRATRPQEKWRPPRRTKIPPKYVVNPRTVRTTFSRNWGKTDGSPAYGRMYRLYAVRRSLFTSSPASRNDDDSTERMAASRWRIWRMRHQERDFAIDGGRPPVGYLWPSP